MRAKVDYTLGTEDRLTQVALELPERFREEDLSLMFDELQRFAERHPAKCAQVLMALAALVNLDEGTVALERRLHAITESRVERQRSAVAS